MASINSHCDCAAWTGWLDVMSSHVSSCRLSISLKRPGHSPLTSATNKAFYHSEPPLTGCFLPFLRLLSVNLRNIRVSKSQQISNFWNTNVAHTNNHATLKVTEITSLRLDFFKHQLSFIVWKGLVLILFLFVSMSVFFFKIRDLVVLQEVIECVQEWEGALVVVVRELGSELYRRTILGINGPFFCTSSINRGENKPSGARELANVIYIYIYISTAWKDGSLIAHHRGQWSGLYLFTLKASAKSWMHH